MRAALTFLVVVVGLAILAGIMGGVGYATGHIKHQCVTLHHTSSSLLAPDTVTKTCSWKVK